MPINSIIEGKNVPIKIWAKDIDENSKNQLINISHLPFLHKHVAAMPDVHFGIGATVGSVLAMKGAIVPSAVGVDIGCGMCAIKTNLKAGHLPDSLKEIRHQIERDVPVGFNEHSDHRLGVDDFEKQSLFTGREWLKEKYPSIVQRQEDRLWRQLGTLGGGNHFIELCLDQDSNVWIMLHSGSRNIGKVIADCFISIAKERMQEKGISLPDKDLAWLEDGSQEFRDYIQAVSWAQNYALTNREVMMRLIFKGLLRFFPNLKSGGYAIQCHHNYVAEEEHFGESVLVTRKGAVRAFEGDMGIIPGSMGAKSFIVRGKGNPESFKSCSHGAGRRMSRGEAKRRLTIEDLAKQTEGVECRKDADVLDEAPAAYKSIDEVMECQSDLVEVVATLKQVLCVKG